MPSRLQSKYDCWRWKKITICRQDYHLNNPIRLKKIIICGYSKQQNTDYRQLLSLSPYRIICQGQEPPGLRDHPLNNPLVQKDYLLNNPTRPLVLKKKQYTIEYLPSSPVAKLLLADMLFVAALLRKFLWNSFSELSVDDAFPSLVVMKTEDKFLMPEFVAMFSPGLRRREPVMLAKPVGEQSGMHRRATARTHVCILKLLISIYYLRANIVRTKPIIYVTMIIKYRALLNTDI